MGSPSQGSRPGVAVQSQRIVEATRELLAVHPIEDLTARTIAEAAGVSRATFYRCYPAIQDVIAEIYEGFSQRVVARLEMILAMAKGPEWLGEVVERIIEDAHAMGPILIALYREELRPDSIGGRFARQRAEVQVDLLEVWWRETQDADLERAILRMVVQLFQVAGIQAAGDRERREIASIKASTRFAVEAMILHHRAGRPALGALNP